MFKQLAHNSRLRLVTAVLGLFLLSGCNVQAIDVLVNSAKWNKLNQSDLFDYEYVYQPGACLDIKNNPGAESCTEEEPTSYKVRVIDGEVVYVIDTALSFEVNDGLENFYTMDGLLNKIKADLIWGRLRVTEYDKVRGYPLKSEAEVENASAFNNFTISNLTEYTNHSELGRAAEQWKTKVLDVYPELSYTLSYDLICFCFEQPRYEVEVVNQVITSVLLNGEAVKLSEGARIEDLFEIALKHMTKQFDAKVTTQSYEFTFGAEPVSVDVPSKISLTDSANIADSGTNYSNITISNFRR